MKAVFTKIVANRGIITKSLIIASIVLITLPSCKHKQGGCDAYTGSARSVKAHNHH